MTEELKRNCKLCAITTLGQDEYIDCLEEQYEELEKENEELKLLNEKMETWINRFREFKEENEQLKKQVSYLKDNLRVARKDREDLQDAVANGLEDFIKEKPYTSLRFLANKELKEKIKIIKEKLFNLLSEYEIGDYDNNIHQFYKDVYAIHNELMELTE